MPYSLSSIDRLLKALSRESHRGIWAIRDPEDSSALLVGQEETGILRIKNIDRWDGKYEELEQRILGVVGAWIAGHRSGFGPNVEMISSDGRFPEWGFSESEQKWISFVKYLRETGRIED